MPTPRAPRCEIVSLRDVTSVDLPSLYDHQADPVATAMAEFPARDRDSFLAHWAKVMADPAVICRTVLADGVVAGNIVAFDFEGRREIGYWLGREFWGQGIATRAVAAFVEIEATRPLYAAVARRNLGSLTVLERCGFVRCGEQDALVDLVLAGPAVQPSD